PDQLAEHDAKLARKLPEVALGGHERTIDDRLTVQLACIIQAVPATLVSARRSSAQTRTADDRYKWIALSNVTLGVLLATLDASITLIAMPDIFRGIHLDPLQA